MADKIAPGVTVEGPDRRPGGVAELEEAEAMERAKAFEKRRDDAKWYIMMGVAMLFAGGLSAYLAAGGAAMCLWGLATYWYWGRRARGAYDPWQDRELDDWEEDQYR